MHFQSHPRALVLTPCPTSMARACTLLFLFVFAAGTLSAQSSVLDTRKALAEYVEAKRTISAEREAWRLGKQTLQAQMEVVQREIALLDKRITDAQASIAEAGKKFGKLAKERDEREQVSKVLVARIATLEERTASILPRVPGPLARNIEPISQRLPQNDEQRDKLSLSVRYQNVIGVLNAIDKWNRQVTLKNELRELGSGQSVAVDVLYIGLGQGYYVGGKGKDGKATIGGVGIVGPDGWQWRPNNEMAPAIQRAVSIYKNEGLAKLVRLPVQIR